MNPILLALLLAACSSSPVPSASAQPSASCPCCCPADAGVVVPPRDAPVIVDAPPLPPVITPSGHPKIYIPSQRARLLGALSRPAGVRWRAAVDRWLGGADLWGFGAWNGALLSQLTGDARYCAKAVTVIDAQVSSAEAKISAGAIPEVAGDSYLQVGEMVGDLALVHDWCYPQTSASQRARWTSYANQSVANVWSPSSARWGGRVVPWSGWSVDNPSNNYFYSFLRATMLLGLSTSGENASADAWLLKTRERMGLLATVFARDLQGGGSREGTGYGVAMRRLFELYALWWTSTGEDLASKTTHARESLTTFLYQLAPTLDRVAPAGDHSRDSTAALFDYHREYLLGLMSIHPTDPVAGMARTMLDASSVPAMTQTFMLASDVLYEPTVTARPVTLPLVRHAKGIGQVYARSDWTKGATWFNATAGPYTESHAHQDQGSLMLYRGGWLVEDANLHSKSGLAQATSAHSLVRIEGISQRVGTTSAVTALRSTPGVLFVSMDVTAAWASPRVTRARRSVLWIKSDVFVIYDRVASASDAAQVWQVAVPVAPVIAGSVATVTNAGHAMRVARVTPAGTTWTSHDMRGDADFVGGWRLEAAVPGGDRTYVHVISLDGVATSAPVLGGVAVTYGGSTSTVTFGDANATLVRDGVTTELAGFDP